VTINLHFSDKRLLERIVVAIESIDKTLKAPPEDFTKEDQKMKDMIGKADEELKKLSPQNT